MRERRDVLGQRPLVLTGALRGAPRHGVAEVDDELNVLWALEVIVEAALARGDAKFAARAWGVTQPLQAARGIAGSVIKLSGPAELHAALPAALGDEEFDACFRAGRDDPAGTLDAIVDGR